MPRQNIKERKKLWPQSTSSNTGKKHLLKDTSQNFHHVNVDPSKYG